MKTDIETKCAFDEMVELEKMIGNPRNPNKHPENQIRALARIIKAQGWRAPITVSRRSGFVVRGHGRLEAARILGCEAVPVDFQDYSTEAEEWADLVADNRIAELSEFSDDALTALLKEIDETDFDLTLTGFEAQEIDDMLTEALEGLDEADPPPEIEFTEELLESMNFIVLLFDNDIDWMQAQTLFDLKTVRCLDDKEGFQRRGIGRVLRGPEAIEMIREGLVE